MEIIGDTLKTKYRANYDAGSYSIIEVEFIISDNELIPHTRKFIKGAIPMEGHRSGNPISGAGYKRITIETFGRNNDEPSLSYSFEAMRTNGSNIFLKSSHDSIVLYLPDVDRYGSKDPRSMPVEIIYVGNDSIRVGPIRGGYIAVYWNSRWHKTTRDQVIIGER